MIIIVTGKCDTVNAMRSAKLHKSTDYDQRMKAGLLKVVNYQEL